MMYFTLASCSASIARRSALLPGQPTKGIGPPGDSASFGDFTQTIFSDHRATAPRVAPSILQRNARSSDP